MKKAESQKIPKNIKSMGNKILIWIEDAGLLIIALSTIIAMGFEINHMIDMGTVALADLLLMFIYLEVIAMVAIYFESGKLPVRMPLYIAIVALARYMILDMKNMDSLRLLAVAGSALSYCDSGSDHQIRPCAFSLQRPIQRIKY